MRCGNFALVESASRPAHFPRRLPGGVYSSDFDCSSDRELAICADVVWCFAKIGGGSDCFRSLTTAIDHWLVRTDLDRSLAQYGAVGAVSLFSGGSPSVSFRRRIAPGTDPEAGRMAPARRGTSLSVGRLAGDTGGNPVFAQRRDFVDAAGAVLRVAVRAAEARYGRCPKGHRVGDSCRCVRCYTPRWLLCGDLPHHLSGTRDGYARHPQTPRSETKLLTRYGHG